MQIFSLFIYFFLLLLLFFFFFFFFFIGINGPNRCKSAKWGTLRGFMYIYIEFPA